MPIVRFRNKLLIGIPVLVVCLAATHTFWLPWLAKALMHDDGPAKAEIAVVLAGDYYGWRLERAAQLVKQGYVPAVLVSGPPYFDAHECDEAIRMMVNKGYPANWFVPFPNEALSTREEADDVLRELHRRGIRSFLLVTSNYHSRRASRLYRAEERALGVRVPFRSVTAEDKYFRTDGWWRSRESAKILFFEWCKTAATALGM